MATWVITGFSACLQHHRVQMVEARKADQQVGDLLRSEVTDPAGCLHRDDVEHGLMVAPQLRVSPNDVRNRLGL